MVKVLSSKNIPFSKPDIGEDELNEVIDTLKSGWLTTGQKVKTFDKTSLIFWVEDYMQWQ